MGIDPNNHRLSHKFPSLQNQTTSGSSASSGLNKHKEVKNNNNNDNNIESIKKPKTTGSVAGGDMNNNYEQVSDAASGLEDESSGLLPDLNLDLTINIPSTIPTGAAYEDNQKPILRHHESKSPRMMQLASSPTLLLFQ